MFAFIVGGWGGDLLKDCIQIDLLNQKQICFGKLNQGRNDCGAIKFSESLYIFGGIDNNGTLDSIESITLNSTDDFKVLTLNNQYLLE